MRRVLTWLALVVFSAGSAAAVVRAIRIEQTATPPFSRDDLKTWLEGEHRLDDPANTEAVRRRAARQLDQDFHAAFDWQPVFEALPPKKQDAFLANYRALLALLVEQRADAYFALSRRHREAFLDAQINDLVTWYVVGKSGKAAGLALFQQGMLAMKSGELSAPKDKQAREFVQALQSHLMKRSFGRMLPLSGENRERAD